MKQKEYYGWGMIKKVDHILENGGHKAILLVRGRKSYGESGAEDALESLKKKYEIREFVVEDPFPTLDAVVRGVNFVKANPVDIVFAVGGGNV